MENNQLTQKEKRALYMMKYNQKYREQHKETLANQTLPICKENSL